MIYFTQLIIGSGKLLFGMSYFYKITMNKGPE